MHLLSPREIILHPFLSVILQTLCNAPLPFPPQTQVSGSVFFVFYLCLDIIIQIFVNISSNLCIPQLFWSTLYYQSPIGASWREFIAKGLHSSTVLVWITGSRAQFPLTLSCILHCLHCQCILIDLKLGFNQNELNLCCNLCFTVFSCSPLQFQEAVLHIKKPFIWCQESKLPCSCDFLTFVWGFNHHRTKGRNNLEKILHEPVTTQTWKWLISSIHMTAARGAMCLLNCKGTRKCSLP